VGKKGKKKSNMPHNPEGQTRSSGQNNVRGGLGESADRRGGTSITLTEKGKDKQQVSLKMQPRKSLYLAGRLLQVETQKLPQVKANATIF